MARWVAGGGGGGGMTGAQIAADPAVRAAFVSQAPAPTGVAATDQAVVQGAIDAANAAGGGVVQLQRGDYAMNAELVLKNRVLLRGKGPNRTTLRWATDLGAGKYAVRQDPDAGIQIDAPTVELLTIQGPTDVTAPNGAAALMDGWRIGRDVNGTQVQVFGFRAGGVIVGDHNTMTQCKFSRNTYNVLYAADYLSLGNQYWITCNFTGAGFASIAVDGNNIIDGTLFVGGHAGFAPYGIARIDTAATGSMMKTTTVQGLSFEVCGNAAINDASTVAGNSLNAVSITQPGFSWSSGTGGGWGWRIPELPRDYAVNVRGVSRTWIRSGADPFTAGDVATYNLAASSSYVSLHIEEPQNSIPTFAGSANNVRLDTGEAQAVYRRATVAVTANDLLEVNGTSGVAPFGVTGRAFAGVALNTAAVNGWVAVAYDGRVSVNAGATAVVTGGVPLKPAAGALTKVAPASGTGAGAYANGGAVTPDKWPIVGYAETDLAANSTNRKMWLTGAEPDRTYVTPGAVTALPTASSAYRGQMLRVEGAAGVADGLYVCMKDAANAYAWKTVA